MYAPLQLQGAMEYIYPETQEDIILQAGEPQEQGDYGTANIVSDVGWKLIGATGEEANLTFWSSNTSKKTELGWIPPDNSCTGWIDKYLYDRDNNRIQDDKNKDIKLKCESSKCNGDNCYHISLTDAQAINIDDYVKLGESSSITEYQDLNLIVYDFDVGHTNSTLLKDGSIIQDVFVYWDYNKWKSGANDSSNINLANYSYVINSTHTLYAIDEYIFINRVGNETHTYNFTDICSKNYSDCYWELDEKNLRIDFVSTKDIDPQFAGEQSPTYEKTNQIEEYTPSTKKICNSNECKKTYYLGERFAKDGYDGQWKKREEALIIKSQGGINIEEDSNFTVNVLKHNKNSITLELSVAPAFIGQDIPLKTIYQNWTNGTMEYINKKTKYKKFKLVNETIQNCTGDEENLTCEDIVVQVSNKLKVTVPFKSDYIIKFGFNSTTVTYNYLSGSDMSGTECIDSNDVPPLSNSYKEQPHCNSGMAFNMDWDSAKFESSDDDRHQSGGTSSADYTWHKFNVTINEDITDVNYMNWTWEGDAFRDDNGGFLYIYNYGGAGSWEQFKIVPDGGGVDSVYNVTISSAMGIINYVSSGVTNIVIKQNTDGYSTTWTDYISLEVAYSFNTSNYNHHKNFSIEPDNVDSNLTNFPVYVYFNDSDIGGNTTTGFDIRFSDNNDNELSYERESYSVVSGRGIGHYWVKVPEISSTAQTPIKIWFGNKTGTSGFDGNDATNVWDDDYLAVWHFANGQQYNDSTSNDNDGTAVNTPTSVSDGKMGYAMDFEAGDSDAITFASTILDDHIWYNFTISTWYKADGTGMTDDEFLFHHGTGALTDVVNFYLDDAVGPLGELTIMLDGPTGTYARYYLGATNIKNPVRWSYLTSTRNSTSIASFEEGVRTGAQAESANTIGTGINPATNPPSIGDSPGDTEQADGYIDEMRISDIQRSDDWIKFEFHNMNSSTKELNWSEAGGAPADNAPVSYLISPVDDVNYTKNTVVTFTCNATDDNGLVNVTLYVWNSDTSLNHTNYSALTGVSNSTAFTYNFTADDLYDWNCLAYDDNSAGDWASANWTVNISTAVATSTTFSVTLPAETTQPIFSPPNATAKNFPPSNQTTSVCFFNISNQGNVDLNFSMAINLTLPSTMTFFVDDDNTPTGALTITKTSIVIANNLIPTGTIGIWLWTNFSNPPQQILTSELNISTEQT